MGWNPSLYRVNKIWVFKQCVHLKVLKWDINVSFYATFVYTSNDFHERRILLDLIRMLGMGRSKA